jgi:hypothetical protein
LAALTKIQRPLYVKHPMTKFAWTRTEDSDIVSVFLYQNNEAYESWTPTLTQHGHVDTANVKTIGQH